MSQFTEDFITPQYSPDIPATTLSSGTIRCFLACDKPVKTNDYMSCSCYVSVPLRHMKWLGYFIVVADILCPSSGWLKPSICLDTFVVANTVQYTFVLCG